MAMAAPGPVASTETLTASVERHARELAAAVTAGLALGFLINGWGMRLAMMLLARLNPEVTGRISDDGFRMGQFTLGDTMGLVLFGTATGVIGALVYLAIRGLRFGPPWFRLASMTLGPAVVVGNILVHTDGIDFRVLHPTALTISLFVFLPGLFALTLSLLVDRWTEPSSRWLTGSRWTLLPLAVFIPLFILIVFAVAVIGLQAANDTGAVIYGDGARRGVRLAARLGLTGIFGVSLVSLTGKVVELL